MDVEAFLFTKKGQVFFDVATNDGFNGIVIQSVSQRKDLIVPSEYLLFQFRRIVLVTTDEGIESPGGFFCIPVVFQIETAVH